MVVQIFLKNLYLVFTNISRGYMPQTNLILIGLTGVGKSALINYLYGHKVVESGVGMPVTKPGIHQVDETFTYRGVDICVWDSAGLEPDKVQEFNQQIVQAIATKNSSEEVSDWFHTVVYCIDAARSRLDEYETQLICNLLNCSQNPHPIRVIIALTKWEHASEQKRSELKRVIANNEVLSKLKIIPVETENVTLFSGDTISSCGDEELKLAMMENLRDNLFVNFQAFYKSAVGSRLIDIKRNILQEYDKQVGRGVFQKFDEKFKKDVWNLASQCYRKGLSSVDKDCSLKLDDIYTLIYAVQKSYGVQKISLPDRDNLVKNTMVHFDTEEWTNSFFESCTDALREVIRFARWLNPFLWLATLPLKTRREKYRKIVEKMIDRSSQVLEENVREATINFTEDYNNERNWEESIMLPHKNY